MTARRVDAMAGGFRSLSPADLEAYKAGRLGLADLAALAGVTKQAISRALKRRGITRIASSATAASAAMPSPSCPTPTSDPAHLRAIPAADEPFTGDDVRQLAASAAYLNIRRVHAVLADAGALGPSALKAAAASLQLSLGELRALGIVAEEGTGATVLKLHVMTEDEGRATKAAFSEDQHADAAR